MRILGVLHPDNCILGVGGSDTLGVLPPDICILGVDAADKFTNFSASISSGHELKTVLHEEEITVVFKCKNYVNIPA